MIYSVDEIKELVKSAVDPDYYDTIYALFRYMSGDYDPALDLVDQFRGISTGVYGAQTPLPAWPDMVMRNPSQGVHNHQLTSSRIMAQSIVYGQPEIIFDIDHPVVRIFNQQFIRERWRQNYWPASFYDCFMNTEAAGVGFITIGINASRHVDIRSVSPLDMIWDPVNKSPSSWQWFCYRNNIQLHDFLIKYGHMFGSENDAREFFHKNSRKVSATNGWRTGGTATSAGYGVSVEPRSVIEEWQFWSQFQHYTFLARMDEHAIACYWSEKRGEYVRAKNTSSIPRDSSEQGANMFGVIPISVMWDSLSPGVHRPVGKAETTYPIASMMNTLEKAMRGIVVNSPPINIVSTVGMQDDDLLKKIKAGQGVDMAELAGKPIVTELPEPAAVFTRIPGGQIPPEIIMVRNMLDRLLNSATGVGDASRGQRVGGDGERITAFEINTIAQSQGVQARHARMQYTQMVQDVVQKARRIASQFDSLDTTVFAEGFRFTNPEHMAIFLRYPASVSVSEDSIQYQTGDSKLQKRLKQLMQIDIPMLQAGAPIDPLALAMDVYKKAGIADFESFVNAQQGAQMPPQAGMPPTEGMPQANELMNTMPEMGAQ